MARVRLSLGRGSSLQQSVNELIGVDPEIIAAFDSEPMFGQLRPHLGDQVAKPLGGVGVLIVGFLGGLNCSSAIGPPRS